MLGFSLLTLSKAAGFLQLTKSIVRKLLDPVLRAGIAKGGALSIIFRGLGCSKSVEFLVKIPPLVSQYIFAAKENFRDLDPFNKNPPPPLVSQPVRNKGGFLLGTPLIHPTGLFRGKITRRAHFSHFQGDPAPRDASYLRI